jgi:hypothetical protein
LHEHLRKEDGDGDGGAAAGYTADLDGAAVDGTV